MKALPALAPLTHTMLQCAWQQQHNTEKQGKRNYSSYAKTPLTERRASWSQKPSWLQWFAVVVTESQNHRMFRVGRDLWGSSSPTPLPKQGHLQQAAQDLVQVGLDYLQRRRIHNLPGQPVPVVNIALAGQGGIPIRSASS